MQTQGRRPDKRRILILGALLLGLAAVGLTAALIVRAAVAKPVALVLVHPFEDPAWRDALEAEVKEYQSLSRRVTVEVRALDMAGVNDIVSSGEGGWDCAIGPSLRRATGAFQGVPEPLTGSLWGIYYNRDVLAKAGIPVVKGSKGLGGLLAAGAYGIEDFRQACLAVKEAGVTPIALGSQYGWPLAVWIQAFMAADDPGAAGALVDVEYDPASQPLRVAIGKFASFVQGGFVDPSHARKDWPQSIQDVRSGRAAFCLVNEGFVSSLRLSDRSVLGWLPPPGSASEGKTLWAIGSLTFIGRSAASSNAKAADKLLSYLTSEGVTARLSRRLGAPFYAKGSGPNRLIPSVAAVTTHPVIQAMKEGIGQ